MEMKKCILLLLSLLCVALVGASGDVCGSKTSGNWCSGTTGFVSCPDPDFRACPSGLVCDQTDPVLGVVYCVRPSELSSQSVNPSQAPTAPPQRPTSAPTQRPTSAPTQHATQRPTVAATQHPTAAATQHPTAAATQHPTAAPTHGATTTAPVSGNWPNGPVKAIYIDNYCWDASFSFTSLVDAGYNLIILAFFVNTVEWDCVLAWADMTQAQQIATINYAHSKGARIILSTGGSTDTPYTSISGSDYATVPAQFVLANNLDGMDFDLENFQAGFTYGTLNFAATVNWVAEATNTARSILGPNAIITHAPQPPYFGQYGWNDGYSQVYKQAPSINFFLVQFYNNGPTTTYDSIFNTGGGSGASVTEMVNDCGIPANKIVIGKPVHTTDIGDLTQGYNTAAEINAIVTEAQTTLGWNTGVMGWQWISSATESAWISTIYPN